MEPTHPSCELAQHLTLRFALGAISDICLVGESTTWSVPALQASEGLYGATASWVGINCGVPQQAPEGVSRAALGGGATAFAAGENNAARIFFARGEENS